MKLRICFCIIIMTIAAANVRSQNYPLNSSNNNKTKTTCGGWFYDDGVGGNYTSIQDRTITFCPSNPSLQRIELYFEEFSVHNTDMLYLYSGTSVAGTPLTLTDADGNILPLNETNLQGKRMMPLINESSGCITARFVADQGTVGSGWKAQISCVNRCQYPVALLDTFFVKYNQNGDSTVRKVTRGIDTLWNSSHTSYSVLPFQAIDICIGDSIQLIANPQFPETNLSGAYYQNKDMCVYRWQWGDGSVDTIPYNNVAGHRYDDFTGYNVGLSLTDTSNGGCSSRNYEEIRVRIARNPITGISIPTACSGDTLNLSVGYNAQSAIRVDSNLFQRQQTQINQNRVFIPDGPNCSSGSYECYDAPVVFDNFLPNETIDAASDVLSVCINMEHTYLGDLGFYIVCPNGQQAVLKHMFAPGGSRGADLGNPNYNDSWGDPCDSNSNPYGIGANYCFSNQYLSGQRGVISGSMTSPLAPTDTISHSGYFQTPNQSTPANNTVNLTGFSSLIGCPLNGEWRLRVCDGWSSDNGWVFGWQLELSNGLTAGDWDYDVPIDTVLWQGYYISSADSMNAIASYPDTANGFYLYDVSIQDDFGCIWDTTLRVQIFQSYDTTINATICSGSYNGFGFSEDTSGVYIHTFENANGCDSTLTLNLQIGNHDDTIINAEICNGQTYDSNGFNETSAGRYEHFLQTEFGCDSTVTLILAVNNPYDHIIYDTICSGAPYDRFGFNVDTSGTYVQNLMTSKGCDSVITLHLYVKPSYDIRLNETICKGETYSQYGFSADSSGQYVQSLSTIMGCDSTITLNLAVQERFDTTIDAAVCEGETYSSNGFYVHDSGTYVRNLVSQYGCDSIVTLNLKVNYPYDTSYSLFGCFDTPISMHDTTIDQSGDYQFRFQTINGCDSIINVSVRYISPAMHSVRDRYYVKEFPFELDATCEECFDYQWQDGQTTPIIQAKDEGIYYVIASSPCGQVEQEITLITDYGKENIFIPNSFTPDLLTNNIFRLYSFDRFEITFEIYNRYGACIFTTHDQNEGWDGTFKGKRCEQGVYVWRLVYRNIDNPSPEKVRYGNVMLMR
ncbi:MAG: gliding motility-associated C-terminal domain-containing protein [Bacteroidales bacterium]|nr:gliding motility-associated C-terminal domain-containing protein [Bacteroidales bacterium]